MSWSRSGLSFDDNGQGDPQNENNDQDVSENEGPSSVGEFFQQFRLTLIQTLITIDQQIDETRINLRHTFKFSIKLTKLRLKYVLPKHLTCHNHSRMKHAYWSFRNELCCPMFSIIHVIHVIYLFVYYHVILYIHVHITALFLNSSSYIYLCSEVISYTS